MKVLIIIVLALGIVVMASDEYVHRTAFERSKKDATDWQDKANQAYAQLNDLNVQMVQLKSQVAALEEQKSALAAAAAAATPTPAPAPVAPAQPAEMTPEQIEADYSNALAIIAGKNAVGSGFVCKMDGHTYVVTNAHVLCENPGFKITSVQGAVYNIGASAIAVGRDVVRIEVTGAEKSFDAATPADGAKIGDGVVVLGNGEGAGVVKAVVGRIAGLGPDLIEVDAPFVKGNSGSPIIHQLTGKVLGVATYVVERKMDQTGGGSVQTETRRFGYRLDSIKQWQQIDWQAFYAQSAQLAAIETLSNDFIKMFGDTANGLNFDPGSYASPALQRSIRSFAAAAQQGGKTMSIADKKALVEHFIADLRSVSHADILAFNKSTAYDYFRSAVEDQGRFRDELYDGLTRALENIQ